MSAGPIFLFLVCPLCYENVQLMPLSDSCEACKARKVRCGKHVLILILWVAEPSSQTVSSLPVAGVLAMIISASTKSGRSLAFEQAMAASSRADSTDLKSY
jgi:hypothetical protein